MNSLDFSPKAPLPTHPTRVAVRLALLTSLVTLSPACGDSPLSPDWEDELLAGETSGAPQSGDEGADEGSGGETSDSMDSTPSDEGGAGSGEGEDDLLDSRIIAAWKETDGVYFRAIPGGAMQAELPEVAQVVGFLTAESFAEPTVFVSLLDQSGDALLASRVRGVQQGPTGAPVDFGVEVSFFSDWSKDLPIGFCVTEPCNLYPWPEADVLTTLVRGPSTRILGSIEGTEFGGEYLLEGAAHTPVEQYGYDELTPEQVLSLHVTDTASRDAIELIAELSGLPDVDTADLPDPCEMAQNLAKAGIGATATACCAETGFTACALCIAVANELLEQLGGLC
jgi:hypothetical protein